ncbi:unnamed protein product [Penicillium pancosmium]
MASTRKALVIASPYKDLQGTLNDASRIQDVFEKQGFEIIACLGPRATRSGIYDAWQQLISSVGANDTIAIYYSGHGSMVESALEQDHTCQDWRYQFIVPVDFESSTEGDFRGILDIEISHLLRKLTVRTPNVTIILDCCHSGRMARAPAHGDQAAPRWIAPVTYDNVAAFRDHHLRQMLVEDPSALDKAAFQEENPSVVRVVAAAASETAWEYCGSDGLWRGVFTDALAAVLEDCHSRNIPWRTSLLRLHEVVNSRFPSQHPQVEGPETRVPFSLQCVESKAIHIKMEDGAGVLQAGRISYVHEGDIYSVRGLGSEETSMTKEIAECEVEVANHFEALGRLQYSPQYHTLPPEGALAFLKRSALCKWPIKTSPETLSAIGDALSKSLFLKNWDPSDHGEPILELTHEGSFVTVISAHGHRVATRYVNPEVLSQLNEAYKAIIFDAERLARAQHFLALQNDPHQERLDHRVNLEIGVVEDRRSGKVLLGSGTDCVRNHDRLYLHLQNEGETTVYCNILYVNVQGKISLISRSSPLGIELPPGRSYWVGKNRFGMLEGLKISWPSDMSKALPINETLVIMLTKHPLDTRPLESPDRPPTISRTSPTALSSVILQLSHGHKRNATSDQERESNAFQIIYFPLTVESEKHEPEPTNVRGIENLKDKKLNDSFIAGDDLPLPETLTEGQELPRLPSQLVPNQRGIFGALSRAMHRTPPCVWVVNEHSEEITVVISQYRPSRLWSGTDLNVSASGPGLSFHTMSFTYPATRKTLSATAGGLEASTGVFPLWTRRDGFGVITIFKGPDRDLFIENDRIPLGSTVYFHNTPNLRVVEYNTVNNS